MTERSDFIDVYLDDGRFYRVHPKALDIMLRRKLVKKFRRADGWAEVGTSPLRTHHQHREYFGPERRHTTH